MKISIADRGSISSFKQVEVKSIHDIALLATQSSYSLSIFQNNYRNLANFIETEAIGLDIDNGEDAQQLTLEEAKSIFAPYKHIILTSKSHQKEKHGKIADRFRVILFTATPIKSAEDYSATWAKLALDFPAIDPACKDASRFWYKSPTVVSVAPLGKLVVVERSMKSNCSATSGTTSGLKSFSDARNAVSKRFKAVDAAQGTRGQLAASTRDFMVNGSPPGGWNRALYKAAKDMQQQLYTKDEAIRLLTLPCILPGNSGELDSKDLQTIDSAFKSEQKHEPRLDVENNHKAILDKCHLFVDISDTQNVQTIELESGEEYDYCKQSIREILSPKEHKTFKEERVIYASFEYDPFNKRIHYINDRDEIVFNTYRPPLWLAPHFYGKSDLPFKAEPPKIVTRFLSHLTDDNQESVDYLYDWLHIAMTARNYTMLTSIGEQGIGKGVLGAMMEKLVGSSNFIMTRDTIFKKEFNKQIRNRRIVYVDEVALNTKESQDRLKHMVNEKLEIEGKGKDAEYITNYASYYISSNHYDAIKLEPGDRRFSILQLTDTMLLENFNHNEIELSLLANDTIEQLAFYLMGREVTRDMRIPFKSERFMEIMDAGLKGWERYVLETLYEKEIGNRLPFKDIQNKIKFEFPNLTPPGRGKIESLCKMYPDKLRITRPASGGRELEFLKQKA